jgi:methylmalonyl-CoA mutase C-terminal domain/subunit
MIVHAAAQEDVGVLGLSILSGAHLEIIPQILKLLADQGMEDVIVLLGGIIPEQDRAALTEMGVAAVFGPGTSTQQIVQFIESHAGTGASL